MPIADSSERVNLITAYFGADPSVIPASFDVALFNGDPTFAGVELTSLTSPGFARVTITNDGTTWTVDGDQVTALVTLPDPTAAWEEATHWGLYNSTALGMTDAFDEPLDVTAAGAGPEVSITIYFGDSVTDA